MTQVEDHRSHCRQPNKIKLLVQKKKACLYQFGTCDVLSDGESDPTSSSMLTKKSLVHFLHAERERVVMTDAGRSFCSFHTRSDMCCVLILQSTHLN